MSNDERVAELGKKIGISLDYSDALKEEKTTKPNKIKLKKLANKIRKELEEMAVETPVPPHPRT